VREQTRRADHAEGASKLHVDNGAGTSTEVRSETGRVLWRVNICGDMDWPTCYGNELIFWPVISNPLAS